MDMIIIIFLIIATLFALAPLAYVVVDWVFDKRNKAEVVDSPVEETEVPVMVAPVVIPPVVEEVFPEIVEVIEAEEADSMISDDLAMEKAKYEGGAGQGQQHIINIGILNKNFEAGSLITMNILKERKLVSKKAGRIKILADGILEKPLTIKAESYSIQAIKMIELTGGNVIILKD